MHETLLRSDYIKINILPIFPGKVSAIGNKNRLTSEYRSKMLEKGKAPPESKEADAVIKNIRIGVKSRLDAVTFKISLLILFF